MRRVALIGIVAALGCASSNTAPGAAPAETARVIGSTAEGAMHAISTGSAPIAGQSMISAPVMKVWNAVPAIFDSLGIAPTTIDATSFTFGNRGLQIRRQLSGVRLSKYIDCGSAQSRPSADFYDVNLSVVTQLAAADSANTKVVTTVDAMGRPVAFSGEYIRCATTGEIESRISRMLQAAATK
ncbi:MAG TPA: hypothetical protein VJV97_08035 [Gemmatimonadaceae bacterium]|nr:hypothetical protein [Gemmatimonadaceae bacterium]